MRAGPRGWQPNSMSANFLPTHAQMLAWSQGARTPFPGGTVHGCFAEWVARTPEAIAVVEEDSRWSYAELDAWANRLAHRLRARGLKQGGLVGIPAARSAAFVAGALGILKAGGAYVPLDLEEPAERQALRRQDCALILDPTEECSTESSTPLDESGNADTPAYVLYTSGSTGTPKGVVVPHRAINRLVCATDYIEFLPDDVVAFHSNLSFDASTLELWGPLLNGARLIVTATETVLSADALAAHLRHHSITTLWLTTTLFTQLAQHNPTMFAGLRNVVFGGEAANAASAQLVLEQSRPGNLVNGYGPTETTTFACCHRITAVKGNRVPIGRPIANTDAYILDPQLAPAAEGELHIGGPGVALGYLGQSALTAERFIETPFGRLYKTGDLARWRPDGTIDYLGRIDGQIKIRGFRIEPGEIEAAIRRHPGVRQCAVLARPAPSGERLLVAYVVGEAAPDLREFLRDKLPAQMIPTAFVPLPALPLTANGKLDHRALPEPALDQPRPGFVAPRTPLERQLAAVWQQVLGISAAGLDDNFFDLGGTSLLLLRVHSQIRAATGRDVRIVELFQFPTLRALARHLELPGATSAPSAVTRAQERAALARSRLISKR